MKIDDAINAPVEKFQAPTELYLTFEYGLNVGVFTTLEGAENLCRGRAKHNPVIVHYTLGNSDTQRIDWIAANLEREGHVQREGAEELETTRCWVIASQAKGTLREALDRLRGAVDSSTPETWQ